MYIIQALRQHAQPTANAVSVDIETLGCRETFVEAKQVAIDFCQEGKYYHPKISPDGEERVLAHKGWIDCVAGDGWKQIAPMGFEVERNGLTIWIRIESIKVEK